MIFTLDCRALVKLLSQSQDETPPLAVQARIRLHLVTCQACRNVDEQMHFVRAAIQEMRASPTDRMPVGKRPH